MRLAGSLLPLVLLLAWNLPSTVNAQVVGETYVMPGSPTMMDSPVLPYSDMGATSGCTSCSQHRGPIRGMMHNRLCTRCQRRGCCGTCQTAAPCPTCVTAPAIVQPSLVPSLTYRDVPQTMMRREAYAEQVPVTSYKTVAMDEGSFQKVWVPRVVQKQVPVTAYQQQIKYRDVPYTVMQKVPQVQYTPTYTTAVSTGCNTCNQGLFSSPAYSTTMLNPYSSTTPDYSTVQGIQQYPYAPQTTSTPQSQAIPEIGNLNVPVPMADPHVAVPQTTALDHDHEDWQVIRKSNPTAQTAANYDGGITSSASGKFTGVKSSSSVQARSSTDAITR
jgi:hypothetical protein